MTATLYTSYGVQALGALLTAVIFGSFSRSYRRPFLRYWAQAWMALAVSLAGAVLCVALMGHVPASDPTRILLSFATSCAGYMQVAFLLFGAAELRAPTGGVVTPGRQRLGLAAAAFAAVVSTILFSWDPGAESQRFFVRVTLSGFVCGAAYLWTAWVVWRAPDGAPLAPGVPRQPGEPNGALITAGRTSRFGSRVVTVAFALYGLDQFHLFRLGLPAARRELFTDAAIYLSFVDFVLTVAAGAGVVIWLLEQAQHAAEDFAHRIEELAYHDALTALPNRQLFLDRLTQAIPQARREQHRLAVFFVDLDRFKLINDSLGHAVGDQVLRLLADRLTQTLRTNDSVARMGGDEFTVLAPVVHHVDDAAHVALKIRDAVRQPIMIEGRELYVTASVGISLYPSDGETADSLLKNADAAMYRAKSQGADSFQLYTPEMNAQAVQQLAIESAMRRATINAEFELYYQPIVDMIDGTVTAVEAMLRWCHPELGFLRPIQFLTIAETTGMIVQIGEWTIRESCRQLRIWREHYPRLRMALNVSARQLRQPDFVELLGQSLGANGLPYGAFDIEIPEACAARLEDASIERLRELRRRGMRVSIDDFGAGYSGLSRLRGFPVDALKIDTRFVRDLMVNPVDAGIAAAVIALGRAMDLRVIAEGVENPAQLEFLRQQGCDMWQGYLCCPPVEADDAISAFARRLGGGVGGGVAAGQVKIARSATPVKAGRS